MTRNTYKLFKTLNPSIRSYEQPPNGRVKITCVCKAEMEKVEAFISACKEPKEITEARMLESEKAIIIEVISDYQFSKKLVKDFFGG